MPLAKCFCIMSLCYVVYTFDSFCFINDVCIRHIIDELYGINN